MKPVIRLLVMVGVIPAVSSCLSSQRIIGEDRGVFFPEIQATFQYNEYNSLKVGAARGGGHSSQELDSGKTISLNDVYFNGPDTLKNEFDVG